MKSENKALIRATKKKHLDMVSDFKLELQQELEVLCISLGGHDFWPWQSHYVEMLNGFQKETYRICPICGKKEYR